MDTAKSLILCTVLAACLGLAAAAWSQGTATNYGGADGSGTMGTLPLLPCMRPIPVQERFRAHFACLAAR
jgi:hypothetical protein